MNVLQVFNCTALGMVIIPMFVCILDPFILQDFYVVYQHTYI